MINRSNGGNDQIEGKKPTEKYRLKIPYMMMKILLSVNFLKQ